ncbi:hypothetical protein CDAR_477161 [Caerostris darwini]|uniref:Uncharacterized protein n=1 Tax=Caerostris darwini TaxID=1538125 RepID=A0AAV4TTC1_9ARAC|nr:hypothetical protein CDAR_477161 [Caerostris darwini]
MNKKEHSKNSILRNVIQRVVGIVPSLDDNIAVAVIICLARALSFGLNLCHVSRGLICDGWTPPTHTHTLSSTPRGVQISSALLRCERICEVALTDVG